MRAEVLTPWVGDGATTETANRPKILDDYTCNGFTDVTRQDNIHPDPNIYTVQIECDETTMNLIEADPNYVVIWSE